MGDGPVRCAAALLSAIRTHAATELKRLPPRLRSLDPAPPYEVAIAAPLRALAQEVDARKTPKIHPATNAFFKIVTS